MGPPNPEAAPPLEVTSGLIALILPGYLETRKMHCPRTLR